MTNDFFRLFLNILLIIKNERGSTIIMTEPMELEDGDGKKKKKKKKKAGDGDEVTWSTKLEDLSFKKPKTNSLSSLLFEFSIPFLYSGWQTH